MKIGDYINFEFMVKSDETDAHEKIWTFPELDVISKFCSFESDKHSYNVGTCQLSGNFFVASRYLFPRFDSSQKYFSPFVLSQLTHSDPPERIVC